MVKFMVHKLCLKAVTEKSGYGDFCDPSKMNCVMMTAK